MLILVCFILFSANVLAQARAGAELRSLLECQQRVSLSTYSSYVTATAIKSQWNQTGWLGLQISRADPSNGTSVTNEDLVWFAAGFAEGKLLQHEIANNWRNIGPQTPGPQSTSSSLPEAFTNWINRHLNFMTENINKTTQDPYWRSVELHLLQLHGIAAGYSAQLQSNRNKNLTDTGDDPDLNFASIFLLNFAYETGDVLSALGLNQTSVRHVQGGCTAYLKPLSNGDFAMAHTTWSGYESMLRVYKRYFFSENRNITFSGYPGLIHSADDFYQVSPTKLVVIETTNELHNLELYQFTIPETVSEFLRVMVAHQLSGDGSGWAQAFCRYNSGTYNNQYMIIDLKLVGNNDKSRNTQNPKLRSASWSNFTLPRNFVWVLEQFPGMCPSSDVTDVLNQEGYWASYNRPYFAITYSASGTKATSEKYGSYFNYSTTARAVILRILDKNVHSVEDVKKLIRYNHWQSDNASICPGCSNPTHNALLTVSARGDLVNQTGDLGLWTPFINWFNGGAIDAKIATLNLMMKTEAEEAVDDAWCISGPTYDSQPPFVWEEAQGINLTTPHYGQLNVQVFPWIKVSDIFSKQSP